ncbi:hypothetical protein ACFL3G_13315, partial [Planctomycetota bacterium]
LDDFKKTTFFGTKIKSIDTRIQQKGLQEELSVFAKSIKEGDGYPIALWQLVQATEMSFEVERQIFNDNV